MSTPMPMHTRLRQHIEDGCELFEEAMRDGLICSREQEMIGAHWTQTLDLSEEHELTTRLALALQHGGFTKRSFYAGREYDALYGTGELAEQLTLTG